MFKYECVIINDLFLSTRENLSGQVPKASHVCSEENKCQFDCLFESVKDEVTKL